MNTYEYGDCLPDKSSVIDVTHSFTGTALVGVAQIGNTFIGNIIGDCELVTGIMTEQYWEDVDGQELFKVSYDGSTPIVSCYVDGSLVGAIPVPEGESFGIARINGRIVMTLGGLDAYLIKENAGEEPINMYFGSAGDLKNVRAGYSEDDRFSELRDSIRHTTSLNPTDKWLNTVKMDCPEKVHTRNSLLDCPMATCNKKGECLSYVEYDKSIGVSGLKCNLKGLRLCKYTLGIVDSDNGSGKRMLLIDGSRGYISEPVSQVGIDLLFDEYGPNYGMKFEIVVSIAEREALIGTIRNGTYPDMVILDATDAAKPRMLFYRSLSGSAAKLIELELMIPTSLGSDRLVDCRLPITYTFRGRDVVDPCIVAIFNVCTTACSGWINHPKVLDNDWKTSFRVQGDLTFELREATDPDGYITIHVDISEHTLSVTIGGFTTIVNTEILVGNKISTCIVGDVLSIYVDEQAQYRTISEVPEELYIWVECGSTITHALIDPRLNGKMLSGWEGDETFEEISNCDEDNKSKETVIVKDLYCACDTGVIYYREITGILNKGKPERVFRLEPDVYRAFTDIYIDNRSNLDAVISIYIAKTTEPFTSNSIGSNIVVKPGETYARKSQPLAIGESLFVASSRNDLALLIQTVEETFTR